MFIIIYGADSLAHFNTGICLCQFEIIVSYLRSVLILAAWIQ